MSRRRPTHTHRRMAFRLFIFFASGGDFRNVILQVFVLAISVCIYVPFLKLYENTMPIEEVNDEVASTVDDDFSDFAEFT